MQQINRQPAFELRQIVATRALWPRFGRRDSSPASSSRVMSTASGAICPDEDRKENDSLEHGFRLLSSYRTNAGDRLWIIPESDHFPFLSTVK
jgi:hypothetical protein